MLLEISVLQRYFELGNVIVLDRYSFGKYQNAIGDQSWMVYGIQGPLAEFDTARDLALEVIDLARRYEFSMTEVFSKIKTS